MYTSDSPASMSIHEEATVSRQGPMMGVFNNLVMFDQHVQAEQPRNRSCPIWPTEWSWNEDGNELTFKLRQGVKWHDGKPFTAKDVKCTWDLLLEKSADKLRVNPRKSWYKNLDEVTANGDYEVTFHLKRPQPAFLMLLASGWFADLSLPCPGGADAAASDRHRPVQVRRVQAERMHQGGAQPGLLEAGPALSRRHRIHDHREPRRPRSWPSSAGKFDMTFPYQLTMPLLKDIKNQVPQAICELTPTAASTATC